MRRVVPIFIFISLAYFTACAQVKKPDPPVKKPDETVVPVKSFIDKGSLNGHTYTNKTLNFSFTFPETWLVQNDNFEDEMKKEQFQLSLAAPDSQAQAARARMNKSMRDVQVLLTAYHSTPGSNETAILRVSAEDLKANPQIKDAVDYFDAIRALYTAMKLPADVKYSDTNAEKLGSHQYAFLDIASSGGKKRMYATVRKGFAIMFTIAYTSDGDLLTVRQILTEANFKLN